MVTKKEKKGGSWNKVYGPEEETANDVIKDN